MINIYKIQTKDLWIVKNILRTSRHSAVIFAALSDGKYTMVFYFCKENIEKLFRDPVHCIYPVFRVK